MDPTVIDAPILNECQSVAPTTECIRHRRGQDRRINNCCEFEYNLPSTSAVGMNTVTLMGIFEWGQMVSESTQTDRARFISPRPSTRENVQILLCCRIRT